MFISKRKWKELEGRINTIELFFCGKNSLQILEHRIDELEKLIKRKER